MPRLPINQDPQAGVFYSENQYPGFDPFTRDRNRRRIRIFLSAVAISLLAGLSYTFLRPAIYESRATLLVNPPAIDERAGEVTNMQHVELELQSLTRYTLLSGVLEKLSAAGSQVDVSGLTLPDLQEMLAAVPVENTNLVELTARGTDKYLLPVLINTWIDSYQEAQRVAVSAESISDTAEADQQLAELKQKVEEKRQALDRFRKDHDILSMERNENRALKKLAGLTDSLNKAGEENVTAQARLAAIRNAIASGKPVSSDKGQNNIAHLEERLVDIQEQLKELENEFTPRYMSVDPQIKGLVRKRDMLEEQIRSKRMEGQQTALAEAERDVASSRQAVASLSRQLDEQQQQVMDFTTRFAEHEALQEELLQLETLYREVQDRQLQLQVNTRSQYPQVRLKERPYLPERPSYPDYMRDAGISVVVSLLAGLLLLLLYDFLTRPARHSGTHDIKQVFVTSPQNSFMGQEDRVPLQQPAAVPALEQQLPRELSPAEVLELLRAGGADVRLLISCLLSGLTADELRTLRWEDIDSSAGVIHARGEGGRTIPLSAALGAAVADWMPPGMTPAGLVWQTADGRSPAMEDFAAMLLFTAHDAGLTRPSEVTLEAVRHTYVGYLVRQGVRLIALPRLVGDIAPRTLAAYAAYSPPGAGAPLESVESVYPALQGFYQPNAPAGPTPGQSG
jgi:uncharacterized protein involved in exopolysaccharide biosynthesis